MQFANVKIQACSCSSMASLSKEKSQGPVLRLTSVYRRSASPPPRFSSYNSSCSSCSSYESSYSFASSTSSFSSASFFSRSTSPTRVHFYGLTPPSSAVRFSIHRSTSPSRSISSSSLPFSGKVGEESCHGYPVQRKTCMCSPTTHPGSFRCSLHKKIAAADGRGHGGVYASNRLNARRSAMTNSLVRIGTVEGEWVKRALTALIRPSSHQQRRRHAFQPKPSRLRFMSRAGDDS